MTKRTTPSYRRLLAFVAGLLLSATADATTASAAMA
jgi:hypothetical protein